MEPFKVLGIDCYLSEYTEKDFAKLFVNAAKEINYRFPEEELVIRFVIIDSNNCDFAFLLYPKKEEENKEKKAFFIPIPSEAIDTIGGIFSPHVQACCIFYDSHLTRRMQKACELLNKKYKTSKFEYLPKYSPYTTYILDDIFKNKKGYEYDYYQYIAGNMTFEQTIEFWKENRNKEAATLYGENTKEKFFDIIKPKIFFETKEHWEQKDIHQIIRDFWILDMDIYCNKEIFGNTIMEAKTSLKNLENCIRNIYKKPAIVKVVEKF